MQNTLRAAAAAVFAYETVAIASGRFPTISRLCSENRWLTAAAAIVLVIHLEQTAGAARGAAR